MEAYVETLPSSRGTLGFSRVSCPGLAGKPWRPDPPRPDLLPQKSKKAPWLPFQRVFWRAPMASIRQNRPESVKSCTMGSGLKWLLECTCTYVEYSIYLCKIIIFYPLRLRFFVVDCLGKVSQEGHLGCILAR